MKTNKVLILFFANLTVVPGSSFGNKFHMNL